VAAASGDDSRPDAPLGWLKSRRLCLLSTSGAFRCFGIALPPVARIGGFGCAQRVEARVAVAVECEGHLGVESDRCEREDEPMAVNLPAFERAWIAGRSSSCLLRGKTIAKPPCGLPVKWSWTTAMPWLASAT
jgi:hypothetical protein